jgi:hypothetical protein
VPSRRVLAVALALLLLGGGALGAPTARAAGYPALPAADEGRFLSGIAAPVLAPGGSGALTFTLTDPLSTALAGVVLTFGLYGFNAFPGNATGPLPSDGVPTFTGVGAAGASDSVRIGALGPGESFSPAGNVSVGLSVPASAPSGTYAIRTSLAFRAGNTSYLLESKGYFTAAQWASATILPNRSATLNLSRLGVSGVLAETALLVETNSIAPWLYGVLAASLLLAAAGGYVAWRRSSRSSSGARTPPPPQKARTAFGSSRRSDGD